MSESNTITVRVFRVLTQGRANNEWRYANKITDRYSYSRVSDPLEADNLIDDEPETIIKRLEMMQNHIKPGEKIELVDVRVETHTTTIDIDDGDFLEMRRKQALQKLSTYDIEALGLEKLAAYNKLKFHGDK